jgi:hypothetical protein
MAGGRVLVCRPLRYHAGSHPFILRTQYISGSTIKEMDRVLEESRYARMGQAMADSHLAT